MKNITYIFLLNAIITHQIIFSSDETITPDMLALEEAASDSTPRFSPSGTDDASFSLDSDDQQSSGDDSDAQKDSDDQERPEEDSDTEEDSDESHVSPGAAGGGGAQSAQSLDPEIIARLQEITLTQLDSVLQAMQSNPVILSAQSLDPKIIARLQEITLMQLDRVLQAMQSNPVILQAVIQKFITYIDKNDAVLAQFLNQMGNNQKFLKKVMDGILSNPRIRENVVGLVFNKFKTDRAFNKYILDKINDQYPAARLVTGALRVQEPTAPKGKSQQQSSGILTALFGGGGKPAPKKRKP